MPEAQFKAKKRGNSKKTKKSSKPMKKGDKY